MAPYQLDSALGAGLGVAGAMMQGQQQRRKDDMDRARQAQLDQSLMAERQAQQAATQQQIAIAQQNADREQRIARLTATMQGVDYDTGQRQANPLLANANTGPTVPARPTTLQPQTAPTGAPDAAMMGVTPPTPAAAPTQLSTLPPGSAGAPLSTPGPASATTTSTGQPRLSLAAIQAGLKPYADEVERLSKIVSSNEGIAPEWQLKPVRQKLTDAVTEYQRHQASFSAQRQAEEADFGQGMQALPQDLTQRLGVLNKRINILQGLGYGDLAHTAEVEKDRVQNQFAAQQRAEAENAYRRERTDNLQEQRDTANSFRSAFLSIAQANQLNRRDPNELTPYQQIELQHWNQTHNADGTTKTTGAGRDIYREAEFLSKQLQAAQFKNEALRDHDAGRAWAAKNGYSPESMALVFGRGGSAAPGPTLPATLAPPAAPAKQTRPITSGPHAGGRAESIDGGKTWHLAQ